MAGTPRTGQHFVIPKCISDKKAGARTVGMRFQGDASLYWAVTVVPGLVSILQMNKLSP